MSTLSSAAIAIGLFAGIVVCLDLGYRVGRRRAARNRLSREGISALEAAVFGLLSLLLAFAFAGATSRLESRRQLIVDEANAIGTAYLRIDAVASEAQPELRRLFREYLGARMRVYDSPDLDAARREYARAVGLQQQIWTRGVAASGLDPSQRTMMFVLPAFSQMIDMANARSILTTQHLPWLVFVLLIVVALLSAVLAGNAMASQAFRSWLHILLFAAAVSVTVYVVLDLDYPRAGLIRVGAADQALHELQESIRE